jgi:TM2 domain-containing membrane protein YozV
MQFQVPQYIEVEDKLVGPLSLKQFVYLAGAGGFAYILWKKLPIFIALPLIGAIAWFALMLAFYPREKFGKPFVEIVQSGFKYFMRTRLYTWKKLPPKITDNRQPATDNQQVRGFSMPIPTVTEGKLKDLSWNVDVAGDKEEPSTNHELPTSGRHEV